MSKAMTHTEFKELVAAYRAGWLDGSERIQFEQHLHACPDCATEMEKDARLGSLLAQAQVDPAPPSTREAVIARHRARRPRHLVWKPALGFATAVLVAVAGYNVLNPPDNISNPGSDITASVVSDQRLVVDAHQTMSAADLTGDASAAVLRVVATRQRVGNTP